MACWLTIKTSLTLDRKERDAFPVELSRTAAAMAITLFRYAEPAYHTDRDLSHNSSSFRAPRPAGREQLTGAWTTLSEFVSKFRGLLCLKSTVAIAKAVHAHVTAVMSKDAVFTFVYFQSWFGEGKKRTKSRL